MNLPKPAPSTVRGRPPEQAPIGYVSLAEAARRAGVSYKTARQRVLSKAVRSVQTSSSARFVLEADLPKIQVDRHASPRPRAYIVLQPGMERYARWVAAANTCGQTVSAWLSTVADRALVKLP